MKPRLTREAIQLRLKDHPRKIVLIGEYLGSKTKTMFECSVGHKFMATPDKILNLNRGCSICVKISDGLNFRKNNPITKEEINDRLRVTNRGIILVGEYLGTHKHTLFRCSKNHEWYCAPSNAVRGYGCPSCANFGFDPTKPTHGYILLFDTFIKYGITTDLKIRLMKHKTNNGSYILHKTKLFETGHDAISWENNIKKTFGGKYVDKELCPDGWTETLPIEKLSEIEKLL
jgi:hypothetical protein